MEQRGRVILRVPTVNRACGRSRRATRSRSNRRLDDGSCMSGDVHVQFCERPGVRFPRATHLVVGCQRKADAEQFLLDLKERMSQFALELHPDKTRLIEFGRFAMANRRARGERRPETFDFLGFTNYCRKTRNGGFGLGRKPIAKRVTRTLKRLKERLRARMHDDVHETAQWLGKVVNGWLNYYAVPTSSRTLCGFVRRLEWNWLATLRRRSQKTGTTMTDVTRLTALYWPPVRARHPWPATRFAVNNPR